MTQPILMSTDGRTATVPALTVRGTGEASGTAVVPVLRLADVATAPRVDPVQHLAEQLRDPAVLARLHAGRVPVRSFDAQYWACWALVLGGLLTAVLLVVVR